MWKCAQSCSLPLTEDSADSSRLFPDRASAFKSWSTSTKIPSTAPTFPRKRSAASPVIAGS